MVFSILIGCILIVICIFIHALATRFTMELATKYGAIAHLKSNLKVLWISIIVLIMVGASLIESLFWAITYIFLGAIEYFEEALYFSIVTFNEKIMKAFIILITMITISCPSFSQEEVLCDQMNDLEIGKMIIGLRYITDVDRVLDSCGCTYSISEKNFSTFNLMLNSKNGGVKNWKLMWAGYPRTKYVMTDIDIYYKNSNKSDMMDIVEYNVLNDKIDFKNGKLRIEKRIGRGSSRLYLKYR